MDFFVDCFIIWLRVTVSISHDDRGWIYIVPVIPINFMSELLCFNCNLFSLCFHTCKYFVIQLLGFVFPSAFFYISARKFIQCGIKNTNKCKDSLWGQNSLERTGTV